MKNLRPIIFVLLILISSVFLLNGCRSKEKDWIVTINGKLFTKEDLLYDIYLIESEGDALDEFYQTKLGMSYWDYEHNGISMRNAAKDTILSRFTMNEILTDQAKKAGITLSEEELAENEAYVDKLLNTTKNLYSELSRDALLVSYNRFSLGDKYYQVMTKSFTIDVESVTAAIIPKDYREYKTECLYVPTVKSENQKLYTLSEDELKASYTSITKALKKIKEGYDFKTIIAEDDSLTLYTRDFILNDNIPEQEYKDTSVLLENGQYSEIITTNYGYYIIHMLDNNSPERYEQAKTDAMKEEEKRQFQMAYEALISQYKIEINSEYWDSITIGSTPKNSDQ